MNRLREQFEDETGKYVENWHDMPEYILWLEQRADHDWGFAHESLARVYREIKVALQHYRNENIESIILDTEVRCEIESLITEIITDIENGNKDNN